MANISFNFVPLEMRWPCPGRCKQQKAEQVNEVISSDEQSSLVCSSLLPFILSELFGKQFGLWAKTMEISRLVFRQWEYFYVSQYDIS